MLQSNSLPSLRWLLSNADIPGARVAFPTREPDAAFHALWARLEAYDPDNPDDVLPFSARLAAKTGWSREKARRVVEEYRRFVAIALSSGHGACPSRAVDEAWHLHLMDTRRYWGEFCTGVLGQDFHHEPGRGGVEEDLQFGRLYRATLAAYRRFFGEAPPADIWPDPDALPVEGAAGPVERRRTLPRLRTLLTGPFRLLVLIAAVLAVPGCAAIYDSSSPDAMQGPEFLFLYIFLLLAAAAGTWLLQNRVLLPPRKPAIAPERLGPYHFAFLADGVQRVFETALARLYVNDHVAMEGYDIVTAKPLPPVAHPVERMVVAGIGTGARSLTTGLVQNAVPAIKQDLADAGLIPSRDDLSRSRQVALLVMGPVLLLGLVRLAFGVMHHKPVLLLVGTLVAAGVGIFLLLRRKILVNAAGRQACDLARERFLARGEARLDDPDLAYRVALGGRTVLIGLGLGVFVAYLIPPVSANSGWFAGGGGDSSASSCSSSSDSSSSSCSSSSCSSSSCSSSSCGG